MIKAQIAALFSLMVMEAEAMKLKQTSTAGLYWLTAIELADLGKQICEERYPDNLARILDCQEDVQANRELNTTFMFWDKDNDDEISHAEMTA